MENDSVKLKTEEENLQNHDKFVKLFKLVTIFYGFVGLSGGFFYLKYLDIWHYSTGFVMTSSVLMIVGGIFLFNANNKLKKIGMGLVLVGFLATIWYLIKSFASLGRILNFEL